MKLYKVWCEYDMGWNVDDNLGVYSNKEDLIEYLESLTWKDIDCKDYIEAMDEGILSIKEIEG